MIEILKKLFGIKPAVNYAELVEQGAVILDVRTKGEFAGGHIRGAVNLPLDQLNANHGKLKNKNTVIITCCASGMRSASAKGILSSKGYTNVYNGGSWMSLNRKLN
jgi:rhodanese-related sulfurtransferase